MTQASNTAFQDTGNKKRRGKTKANILMYLKYRKRYLKENYTGETAYELYTEVGRIGSLNNITKRLSDLKTDGEVEEIGTRNGLSCYAPVPEDAIKVVRPTKTEALFMAISNHVDANTALKIEKEYKALMKFK